MKRGGQTLVLFEKVLWVVSVVPVLIGAPQPNPNADPDPNLACQPDHHARRTKRAVCDSRGLNRLFWRRNRTKRFSFFFLFHQL